MENFKNPNTNPSYPSGHPNRPTLPYRPHHTEDTHLRQVTSGTPTIHHASHNYRPYTTDVYNICQAMISEPSVSETRRYEPIARKPVASSATPQGYHWRWICCHCNYSSNPDNWGRCHGVPNGVGCQHYRCHGCDKRLVKNYP